MQITILQDGLIHLSQAIDITTQKQLIEHIIQQEGPTLEKLTHEWSPEQQRRINILIFDSHSIHKCEILHSLAQQRLQLAHEHCPSIVESENFDLIRLNWYPPNGSIGFHADTIPNMSTQQHLEFTRPVVSISLGNDALFQNRNSLNNHDNDIQQVLLHSGDVVIFGGPSRIVFHSVPKIYPNTISNEEIRHRTIWNGTI